MARNLTVVCGILLIALCMIMVGNVYAANINITGKAGSNFVRWEWEQDKTPVEKIVVDGNTYNNISPEVTEVIISAQPNSVHYIAVFTDSASGVNEITTTSELTNSDTLSGFLYSYIWLIAAIVILLFAYNMPALGLLSVILTVIGLVKGLTDNSFLIFMLYLVTLLISLQVTYARMR